MNPTTTAAVTVCAIFLAIIMNILQFNTRAVSTSRKYLEDYATTSKLDIICLSETWNTDNTPNPPKIRNYTHYWKHRKKTIEEVKPSWSARGSKLCIGET
jgi:hypothetical protein